MRLFLFLLGFTLATLNPVWAKVIELHKGISTDIWVTWPNEARLENEPSLTALFPEWRHTIGAEQISNLRKAGFDFVRLAIDPLPYLWQPSAEKTAKLNDNVKAAVQLFRDHDLNVVVDFHAIPKGEDRALGSETYLSSPAKFSDFVAQSASLAKALDGFDPAHVAYEPINEPTVDCPFGNSPRPHTWRAMALQLHHAVRAAASNLTLVMQGSCWGGAYGLEDLDPRKFNDTNLIWDFHNYEPFLFTHQGSSWTMGTECFVRGLHFPPQASQRKFIIADTIARINASDMSDTHKAEQIRHARYNLDLYFKPGAVLRLHVEAFDRAAAWAKKYHLAPNQIMLGEFGANSTSETASHLAADRLTFVKSSRHEAEKRGFSWALWNWSGTFSPTNNDQDRVVLSSYINALGLVARE